MSKTIAKISGGFGDGRLKFIKDMMFNLFNTEGRLLINSPKDPHFNLEIDQEKLYKFLKKFEKK